MIVPLCPKPISREPLSLTKVPSCPQTYTLNILWLQKEGAQVHMSERGQSLNSQRIWADVSSFTPHFLHNWLSVSPNMWRCLLRVLRPLRRRITALEWVLLKDNSLTLAYRPGPEINTRVCLWVSPMPSGWTITQNFLSLKIRAFWK